MKIEMNLCLNVCILMVKSLAVFPDSYFSPNSFYIKNEKIDFLEKNDFVCIFDRV